MVTDLISRLGWDLVRREALPARPAARFRPDDLPMASPTMKYLRSMPEGIFRHQKEALSQFLQGEDVCLTTGTASGKSLVFYAAGIETLVRDQRTKVIAIYPLKALAKEQEERWKAALEAAGLPPVVGRIDGSVQVTERESILRSNRVVLFTPDVIHAWLLSSLGSKAVREFLAGLGLVVLDEVHTYTGVVGSNVAFVLRRLLHAANELGSGATLRCIGASATVANPEEHLRQLFSRSFRVIDSSYDTSERYPVEVILVRPDSNTDLSRFSIFMPFVLPVKAVRPRP